MSKEHAIKVARYHRDNAQSVELRRYWNKVLKGLKNDSSSNSDY